MSANLAISGKKEENGNGEDVKSREKRKAKRKREARSCDGDVATSISRIPLLL